MLSHILHFIRVRVKPMSKIFYERVICLVLLIRTDQHSRNKFLRTGQA